MIRIVFGVVGDSLQDCKPDPIPSFATLNGLIEREVNWRVEKQLKRAGSLKGACPPQRFLKTQSR